MDGYRAEKRSVVMVRTMAGILRWAVVLIVVGGAVWWLLAREMAAGLWLLAALLMGHGMVHLLFVVPTPAASEGGAEWPFNLAQSWAITGVGLDVNLVRIIGVALITVVVVGFSLAALSTVGIMVPSGWWQPIVAVSAVTSTILLVLSSQPQLALGLGMDLALLWVVVARAWMP
jgi:hypothetical protein